MESMKTLGFSPKDLDDVKSIFLDTNVYLIGLTMFVATVHVSYQFKCVMCPPEINSEVTFNLVMVSFVVAVRLFGLQK